MFQHLVLIQLGRSSLARLAHIDLQCIQSHWNTLVKIEIFRMQTGKYLCFHVDITVQKRQKLVVRNLIGGFFQIFFLTSHNNIPM